MSGQGTGVRVFACLGMDAPGLEQGGGSPSLSSPARVNLPQALGWTPLPLPSFSYCFSLLGQGHTLDSVFIYTPDQQPVEHTASGS